MQKINVIEYLPKIMTELQKGILVNTKNGNKPNTMTIAWGQLGIEWNKFVFTTDIRHTRFTHEQIEATKEFTVSIPLERTQDIAKAISFCGYRNGKNIDKFEECNLTAVDGIDVQLILNFKYGGNYEQKSIDVIRKSTNRRKFRPFM